ncbi:hypothetical protein ACFQ4K_12360 [Tistrella bauzanensis]
MASVDFQSVDILADLRSLPLSGGVPAIPMVEVIRATTGTTAGVEPSASTRRRSRPMTARPCCGRRR